MKNGKPSLFTLNAAAHAAINGLLDESGKVSMSRSEVVEYLADRQAELDERLARELDDRGIDPSTIMPKSRIPDCPLCSRPTDAVDGEGLCSSCEDEWDREVDIDFRFQTLFHPTPGDNILADFYLKGLRKLAKAIDDSIPCNGEPYDVQSVTMLLSAFEFMTGIPANDYRASELLDKYSEEK